jgi:hypothetical protein
MTTVTTVFGDLNEADLKALKSSMKEMSDSMTRMAGERNFIKDEIDALFEKYNIPKKLIRRIAKTYHKQSFQEEVSDDNEFEAIYTGIIEK